MLRLNIRRNGSNSTKNSIKNIKMESLHPSQGIHFLKQLRDEKSKHKLAEVPKGSHREIKMRVPHKVKRGQQPVQQKMLQHSIEQSHTAIPAALSDLTCTTIQEFKEDVWMNMTNLEASTGMCLINHFISSLLRAKMVNWMVEVMNLYERDDQTFFTAVSILDQYYLKSPEKLGTDDIHLTGVVSMFIASKYVDILPLNMKTIYEEISYKQFSPLTIKLQEKKIMQVLGFNLCFPTTLSFIDFQIATFAHQHLEFIDEAHLIFLRKIRNICLFTAKKVLVDYDMLSYKNSTLANSLIYLTLLNENLKQGGHLDQIYINWMNEFISWEGTANLENCGRKVQELFDNFSEKYPKLENLERFEGYLLN